MVSTSSALNLLLVVVDAARLDRFGCYGYRRPTTPAIDALARQATLFERMIAPAPWTLPSHAGLFTGLYSREHGGDRPTFRMRAGLHTLAQHLTARGYETTFVSSNPLVSPSTGLVDGESRVLLRQDFDPDYRRAWARRFKTLAGLSDSGGRAANRAVRGLLSRSARPFFIFVNYMECHWKYSPPRPYERRFVRRRFSALESVRFRLRMRRRFSWESAGSGDEEELALLNDLYDASLACADDRVGDLLEALDRSGKSAETVVVITADHGENLGDHGRTGHGMGLYQTLLHVPCLVRIPGAPGSRVAGLVQLTDLFAGLCGLLNLEIPETLVQRRFSVDPFGLAAGGPAREFAFAEWQQRRQEEEARQRRRGRLPALPSPPTTESVQDEQYKLVVEVASGTEKLYDLHQDPGEQHDRLAELPVQQNRLRAALAEWRASCLPAGTENPYTPEDEEKIQARLRELGYV